MPKPKQTNWKIFFVQQWLHYLFTAIQYIMSGKIETSMLLLISIIIHKIFLFACDWSKCVNWQDIPQPKVGNIWECSLIFKTVHVAKNIWRINTIASIWLWKYIDMFGYLSLDIICSSKLTFFLELSSWKTVLLPGQTISVDKYPSIFLCQMEAIVYIYNMYAVHMKCCYEVWLFH